MGGIEKITGKINEDAKTFEQVSLSQSEKEVGDILDDYKSRAEYNSRVIIEKGKKTAESIISRANSSAALIKRNTVLQMKAALADEVIKSAYERLISMPDDLMNEFLLNIMQKAAQNGRGEVIFNKADREKRGALLIAEANKKAKANGLGNDFVLSETTVDIPCGFILKYGSIEINCALDKIVEAKKTQLEPQIIKILFKNEKK